MSVDFFQAGCQDSSNRKLFGLCDDPAPAKNPAYLDEYNGAIWIAVVENEHQEDVTFTAIDNCIEVLRPDGTMAHRCDGMLTYDSTLILVELKQRAARGRQWVRDAEEQLRETIEYLEKTDDAEAYAMKKAYIANSEHPKFKSTQSARMEQFELDTGYVLRIINRIVIE